MGFSWANTRGGRLSCVGGGRSLALIMMQTSAILYADFMNVIILGMNEKQGYSLQIAGDISSLNLSCTAIGALVGAIWARRLVGARQNIAYIFTIAAVDALSIFITPWPVLACLRGLHGLACGGLLACCGAAMSHQVRPERIMGTSLAIQLVLASVGSRFFPSIVRSEGVGIAFLVMCLIELLTVALVFYALTESSFVMKNQPGITKSDLRLSPGVRLLFAASMVGLFLFQFARFMVVGYGFQIGDFFELKRPLVGTIIGASYWVAGAGAVIATVLPQRLGRTLPLVVSGAGTLVSALLLISFGTDATAFAAATVTSALLTFVALPYHYGVCFAIDERGVMGVWTGFVSKLGLSLGPATGAFLLSHNSLPAVLRISAVLVFAATILASWPAARLDAQFHAAG